MWLICDRNCTAKRPNRSIPDDSRCSEANSFNLYWVVYKYIIIVPRRLIMLSNTEKELIVQIWDKMIPVAEEIGSEALLRYAVLTNITLIEQCKRPDNYLL